MAKLRATHIFITNITIFIIQYILFIWLMITTNTMEKELMWILRVSGVYLGMLGVKQDLELEGVYIL